MSRALNEALRMAFYNWWASLHDIHNDGKHADRGQLAKLRRLDLVDYGDGPAPDYVTALSREPFHELEKKIESILNQKLSPNQQEDLVIVASTLAQIRQNDGGKTAAALGGQKDEDRIMKETRFLRLMRVQTAAELFDQARRLSALLKNKAPVGDLALSLFRWREDPAVRRNWARAYYHLDQGGFETDPSSTEPSQLSSLTEV